MFHAVHNERIDKVHTKTIAEAFIKTNQQRRIYFWKYQVRFRTKI